jgi:hypothetical protein
VASAVAVEPNFARSSAHAPSAPPPRANVDADVDDFYDDDPDPDPEYVDEDGNEVDPASLGQNEGVFGGFSTVIVVKRKPIHLPRLLLSKRFRGRVARGALGAERTRHIRRPAD